MNRNQVRLK